MLTRARGHDLDGPLVDYQEGRTFLERGDGARGRELLEKALAANPPAAVAADARRLLQPN